MTTVFSGNVLKFHISEGQIAPTVILYFSSQGPICALLLSARELLRS